MGKPRAWQDSVHSGDGLGVASDSGRDTGSEVEAAEESSESTVDGRWGNAVWVALCFVIWGSVDWLLENGK